MLTIRTQDKWGAGHWLAPRDNGKRKHLGVDYVNNVGEAITAFEGGEVTKIGYPYRQDDDQKAHFRYCEVSAPSGRVWRYFYCEVLVDVGQCVEKGQVLGAAQDLSAVWEGMTQHCHVDIKFNGERIDPTCLIRC